MTIANNIKILLSPTTSIQEYLRAIKDRFKFVNKWLVNTLMKEPTTAMYNDTRGI